MVLTAHVTIGQATASERRVQKGSLKIFLDNVDILIPELCMFDSEYNLVLDRVRPSGGTGLRCAPLGVLDFVRPSGGTGLGFSDVAA